MYDKIHYKLKKKIKNKILMVKKKEREIEVQYWYFNIKLDPAFGQLWMYMKSGTLYILNKQRLFLAG